MTVRSTGGENLLMPDVSRVDANGESRLLEQLPAQRRQRQLTRLDATAGDRPHDHRAGRYSRMREAEAAQQDTVVVGQDDCPDGTSQLRRSRAFVHTQMIRAPTSSRKPRHANSYQALKCEKAPGSGAFSSPDWTRTSNPSS